ncbi:hypothetical protein Agub_g7471, partial [Astrephomene gubernaculifera]
ASGDAPALRKAVGMVWAASDEVASGPLDNKGCLFRRLAEVMQGVKAAAKELEELIAASQQAAEGGEGAQEGRQEAGDGDEAAEAGREAGKAEEEAEEEGRQEDADDEGEGDEEGDGDDSDDFRDMGVLRGAEVGTAEAAAGLLGAAGGALRAISRPLLEGPPVDAEHCLDEWESLAWHADKLRSGCEALVACLYPPHDDPSELQGQAESVHTTLELMLAEFPEDYLGQQ